MGWSGVGVGIRSHKMGVCEREFPRKREEAVAVAVPSGTSGDVVADDSGGILYTV